MGQLDSQSQDISYYKFICQVGGGSKEMELVTDGCQFYRWVSSIMNDNENSRILSIWWKK